MKKLTTALVAVSLFVPATASASTRGDLSHAAKELRHKVVMRHGAHSAGRDIVKYGVVFVAADHSEKTRRPKITELRRYKNQLAKLIRPRPYMQVGAGPPSQAPAGTQSPAYTPTGLAACIVQTESGGNPQATNGQYHGIAQWDHATWIAHGGGKYANDPLGATKQQQLQVLSSALAAGHSGAWTPYDPC